MKGRPVSRGHVSRWGDNRSVEDNRHQYLEVPAVGTHQRIDIGEAGEIVRDQLDQFSREVIDGVALCRS